jgi:DNA polymerase-3 subunit gamma/tau
MQRGRDAGSFASDLETRARELLVVQTMGAVPSELSLTPESDAQLSAQADTISRALVVRMLELLGAAMEAIRAGADSRTQLELSLVKAASPEVDASTQALLARIERLERQLGTRSESEPPPSSSPPPSEQSNPSPPPSIQPDPSPSSPPPTSTLTEPQAPSQADADVNSEPPEAQALEKPSLKAAFPPTTEPEEQEAPPAAEIEHGTSTQSEPPGEDLQTILGLWPAVVDLIRSENALLGALIAEAKPVEINEDDLVLAFAMSAAFLKKKAEDPANRAMVSKALHQLAGVRLRPSYELREDVSKQNEPPPQPPSEEDLVARLMAEFDAEELPRDPAI